MDSPQASTSATSAMGTNVEPSTSSTNSPLSNSNTPDYNANIQFVENLIASVYYDPKQPGSYYGTVKKIHENNLLRQHKITSDQIRKWLMSQEASTVHRGIKRKFRRNRVLAVYRYDMMDADLADFSSMSKENDGYNFLLMAIDILSRKLYAVPIKNKGNVEIIRGMKIIMSKTPKPVRKIRTDAGGEFTSNVIENYFKSLKIKHIIARNTETKANYIERLIRTIRSRFARYFTYKQTHRYIDNLDDFILSYNNSRHRSIGMAPNEVNNKTEWIAFRNCYLTPLEHKKKKRKSKVYNRYKIGDNVRISRLRSTFPSKYGANWTFEIFKIKRAFVREGLPVYKLVDWNNELIKGIFYENEINKITPKDNEFYHIDQILKRRKRGKKITHYFVSWKGWPATFNQWITAAQMKDIK
jgi:hypothetical protein